MRPKFLPVLLLVLAGCSATPPPVPPRSATMAVTTDELVVQRAILTFHGRQFTLNGYLSLSRAGGKRLVVTENFGAVLADVLVKPDGRVYVERSSALFRPEWIQRYLVSDLECVCGGAPPPDSTCQWSNPSHVVIAHPAYELDLQTLETRPGPQSPKLFAETRPDPS